jgi:carbamoyl-phosphate synthase large subunit
MRKRTDLKKILLIGSGPIIIGQACEFDYSGTQACKALREEGYEVVLVNSNPATIMTDPEMADRTYLEPVTWQVVEKIIEAERPDALLPTLGGQTGLNTAMDLHRHGVLEKYGVEMIGAKPEAIEKGEDREKFKAAMQRIGIDVPQSGLAHSLAEAQAIREQVGLPCVLRPSYTLGGTGGGIAYNRAEFNELVSRGLDLSPVGSVLIEESVIGWKEFELEVMRDRADNVVIICSIENFDPMGVHTGDSITVAPAQTLTDKEYQRMRDAAIRIIREIGVETGGSNIQFAINPGNGRMVAIEMNPRVSRSSALASKATGFPIAKIAAKLAVGYRLDELPNDITSPRQGDKETRGQGDRETCQSASGSLSPCLLVSLSDSFLSACFEPTIDYVVTKVPRWAFEKFPDADATLTTQMKSVGETMAIGRTFKESLQKALRGLETGRFGLGCDRLDRWRTPRQPSPDEISRRLSTPNAERVWYIRYAFKAGMTVEDVHLRTHIDPWFLHNIRELVEIEEELAKCPSLDAADASLLRVAKQNGFSDHQLAHLWGTSETEVRRVRQQLGVEATYKLVDTCAAEFEAYTPYYYSTYEGPFSVEKSEIRNTKSETSPNIQTPNPKPDALPVSVIGGSDFGFVSDFDIRASGFLSEDEVRPPVEGRPRIMILGGGPNRIGQGIEFDYCCCQAAFALREAGYETIMVNSNPETVSTDYDTSDLLFFEPLTAEDVLNICDRVKPQGIIVQFGGQTPLNLAKALEAAHAPIIGTSVDSIDIAEDRERFSALVERLGLKQPESRIAYDLPQAAKAAREIGYPVLIRPSFVLGGRAMEIVYDDSALNRYMERAMEVSPGKPVLIDRFLESAMEVDVDCLSDGRRTIIGGVMQHIEEAGIHSGDSACVIPPYSLPPDIVEEIKRQTRALARELKVTGLMNVQFAIKQKDEGGRMKDEEATGRVTDSSFILHPSSFEVYVLEVNPRASRTVPFVSKAIGVPLAKYASLVMVGKTLDELGLFEEITPPYFSVKESVLPFSKFPGVDILLGPEMRSTGEVMGIDDEFPMAFAKSQMAANSALPESGTIFVSVADRDKPDIVPIARSLAELGYEVVSTRGTAQVLRQAGVAVREIPKIQEGRPNLLDLMKNDEIALVINTPSGKGYRGDEARIRTTAVARGVSCITTLAAAQAAADACRALRRRPLTVLSIQARYTHLRPALAKT